MASGRRKPATSTVLATNGTPPSPIEEIRRRHTPPAGERGQVRSGWYAYWKHLIGLPNPDRLSIDDYRKMETDPQVLAGIHIRELAVLAKPPTFQYTPKNPKDPEEVARGKRMVQFLNWVWNNITPAPHQLLHDLLSARRFGFAVLEKVWASTTDPVTAEPLLKTSTHPYFQGFAYITKLKLLPPETISTNGFMTDAFGNLLGVVQNLPSVTKDNVSGHSTVSMSPGRHRIVFEGKDLERLIVYTVRPEAGNFYGISDHRTAYLYWYAKQANHTGRNLLLERLSGVAVAEYADPNQQVALETALDNIGPGAVLSVPKDSNPRVLSGWEGAVVGFHEALRYDDIQILRAYLVPIEGVGGDGSDKGSFAKAATHFDSFIVATQQIKLEVEAVIEQGFIKPLIDANWGPQDTYPTFDFPDLRGKDRRALADVWSRAISDGYVDPAIDAQWLRAEMDVPEPAPAGHLFQRPTQTPTPAAPETGFPHLAAAEANPLTSFEGQETPITNRLTLEHLESLARVTIAEAAQRLRDQLLQDPPTSASPEELAKLTIPDDWLLQALNTLSRSVLTQVQDHLRTVFQGLGYDDLATRLHHPAPSKVKGKRGRRTLAAQTEDQVLQHLRAYIQWAQQLNEITSTRSAADLAARLRLRVLQGYNQGQKLADVTRALAEEFATYTTTQIDTVSRTTVLDYYNSARNATFDAAGDFVLGIKFVPLLDAATTPFCRALVGRSIRRTDPMYERLRSPPFDYNCRTTVVPVLAHETNHKFDTDWESWFAQHATEKGGGFLGGVA